MNQDYQSGKAVGLVFDGTLTIEPLNSCWERKNENGYTYTYTSFTFDEAGKVARQNYDYHLLSHGVVWVLHLPEGGYALQRVNGDWEEYKICEIVVKNIETS